MLSESDLDAELHPHVVNFLKAPDEEIDPDQAGTVTVWPLMAPPMTRVHRLTLGSENEDVNLRNMGFVQGPLFYDSVL